jgi:hypothetical protein
MPDELYISLIMLGAAFVQSCVGFGMGLIAMPLLAPRLGFAVASPMFSLIALAVEIVMLAQHRAEFRFDRVWRLAIPLAIGIPIGIAAQDVIDDRIAQVFLGLVVMGYALYALISPQLPRLAGRGWPFGLGFISGLLTGAYNTGGPPLIIYGTSQRWSPREFKASIQSLFVVSSLGVIIGHTLAGNLTVNTLRLALITIPAVMIALLAGRVAERYINPPAFRRAVLILLIVLGATLIL